jgi:glycosyltransferase involved in cell wall biosynthesis
MHIGVMGRSVRPGATGVGRFAANNIRSLAEILPKGNLTVFLTQDAPSLWNENVREVRAPYPIPNEYVRVIWEQTAVPRQVRELGIDLYHSPNYILPLRRLSCPSVVTVHDLSFRNLELHRLRSHLYLSMMTSFAVRKAHAVIADSMQTRRRIEDVYPHTVGRVEVIYGGVSPGIRPPTQEVYDRFCKRHNLEHPIILFVGTLEPRKNLPRVVQAFESAMKQTGLSHNLVLLGPKGWKTRQLRETIERSPLRSRILQPGYAYDEELSCWYTAADLLAYPSLDEGFGLPIVEAMALGTPVVTSDRSCMPEVVGDAAITVDPYDVVSISNGIVELLINDELRQELKRVGLERSSKFTWEDAAQRHVQLFERVLSEV